MYRPVEQEQKPPRRGQKGLEPQQYLLLRAMKDEVTNVLRLANLVRENVRAKQLFTPYNSILVTLSGGQDSICSLLLLYLLQNQLGLDFEVAPRVTGSTISFTPEGADLAPTAWPLRGQISEADRPRLGSLLK